MYFQEKKIIQLIVSISESNIFIKGKYYSKGMEFIKSITEKAKKIQARIVYPETEDSRTMDAIAKIINKKLVIPILIGNEEKIKKDLKKRKITNIDKKVIIYNPKTYKELEALENKLYSLRKNKGITLEIAKKILLENKIFFGTMLIKTGKADALISGAIHTTAETIRPALKVIKTKKKNNVVSGLFFMEIKDKLLLFADCAVIAKPSSKQLANIAINTAETAKRFGIKPKVAMLSFSTKGSAEHEEVKKVKDAVKLAKQRAKGKYLIDGELQVDAAIVPEVCKHKCPNCKIKGDANVLIFPDLNSGNIAYKLVQRLAKAKAIGPVFQGLKMPINDLSRGCSVQDIVELTIITAIQTQH